MFELTLPHWPTLDELAAVKYWALGGASIGAGGRLLHWWATGSTALDAAGEQLVEVPGMPKPEEPLPIWSQVLREAIALAFAATIVGLAMNGDGAEWARLALWAGVVAVFGAFWKLVHRPAGQVPVGEAPPDEPADEAGIVAQGTWAAVLVAVASLAFTAMLG